MTRALIINEVTPSGLHGLEGSGSAKPGGRADQPATGVWGSPRAVGRDCWLDGGTVTHRLAKPWSPRGDAGSNPAPAAMRRGKPREHGVTATVPKTAGPRGVWVRIPPPPPTASVAQSEEAARSKRAPVQVRVLPGAPRDRSSTGQSGELLPRMLEVRLLPVSPVPRSLRGWAMRRGSRRHAKAGNMPGSVPGAEMSSPASRLVRVAALRGGHTALRRRLRTGHRPTVSELSRWGKPDGTMRAGAAPRKRKALEPASTMSLWPAPNSEIRHRCAHPAPAWADMPGVSHHRAVPPSLPCPPVTGSSGPAGVLSAPAQGLQL